MNRRRIGRAALAATVLLLSAAATDAAGYRYRGYGTHAGAQGFFVLVEGGLANPRNSNTVVATVETGQDFAGGVNTVQTVIPDWDDDPAGRFAFGYQWANGNRISVSAWGFETDQAVAGDGPPLGGTVHFAVGPPVATMGGFVGASGTPGFFDIASEITAATADITWGQSRSVGDDFLVEWSVGGRYANFEETLGGVYDQVDTGNILFGQDRWAALKTIEAEMFGVRVAAGGSYRLLTSISIGAGVGFSFLDGELTGFSALVPAGVSNSTTQPSSLAVVDDDGRSGSIRDVEVFVRWHGMGDRLQIWLGWEQSVWDDLVTDGLRNFPGSTVTLPERNSLTFSSYKVGVRYTF